MPIGDNARIVKFWEHVLKKIESRLAMWRCKLLSIAGRAQLITSVLNSLPLYFLSMFKVLVIVAKKIVSCKEGFFGDQMRLGGNSCLLLASSLKHLNIWEGLALVIYRSKIWV